MKKTLLASVAAFALVLGASGAVWADGIDDTDVDVDAYSVTTGNIGDDVDDGSAVAVSANSLQQVSTNLFGIDDADDIFDDEMFNDEVFDFGTNTFREQILNVNNFAGGINQSQQGAISVAVAVGDN